MASYHLAVKPVSRSSGRSIVAAAAYRSGELLENPRDGLVHDYTRRHGVEHSEIVGFAGTRQELWGQTELLETRKNARLAVEVEVSLPRELSADQRRVLALEFAQELAAEYRAPVDVSIHNHRLKDGAEHPHAHILVGCRTVEEGQLKDRVVPLDGPEQVERWRERWAERQNLALAERGHEVRVDHRTLAAQHEAAQEVVQQAREAERAPEQVARLAARADGLDRVARVSLSRGAWQAEAAGGRTHHGDLNRAIANDNGERRHLLDQLRELRLTQELERFARLAREKIEQGLERIGLRRPVESRAAVQRDVEAPVPPVPPVPELTARERFEARAAEKRDTLRRTVEQAGTVREPGQQSTGGGLAGRLAEQRQAREAAERLAETQRQKLALELERKLTIKGPSLGR